MTRFLDAFNARGALGYAVCVGLDPHPARVPLHIRQEFPVPLSWFEVFTRKIIEDTCDIAGAYKLNWAFYLRHNTCGMELLERTVRMIRLHNPDVPIILDAKFADIGDTNQGYVEIMNWLDVDAFTAVPFVGFEDGIKPLFELRDRQVFVWIRSSNKSAGDLQNMRVLVGDGEVKRTAPLWQVLAEKAQANWDPYGNLGFIVGAPYVEELAQCRVIAPTIPFLVPGVGTQGGKISEIVPKGRIDRHQLGLVINERRRIIHASIRDDFNVKARVRAMVSNKEIMDALAS